MRPGATMDRPAVRALGDDAMDIAKFQVFGQRCSGTNALIRLLEANFPRLRFCEDTGFKHWLVPENRVIPPDTAVVVIARRVDDWLHSLHRKPWHAEPALKALPFAQFIRAEWRSVWDDDFWGVEAGMPQYGQPIEEERCPQTGRPFANAVAMRTAKLRNWISVASRAPVHLLTSHAELTECPERIVQRFAALTHIARREDFQRVDSYKGLGHRRFVPSTYPALEPEDRSFVRDYACPVTERRFGLTLPE